MSNELKAENIKIEDAGRFADFMLEISDDEEQMSSLMKDPHSFLGSKGFLFSEDLDIQVHENSSDTFHLVFPPDPNAMLQDEALMAVAGGKTASTVGSASTASSASTATFSWGCASSAGSAGSLLCVS